MARIFISYSTSDSEFAEKLATDLKVFGHHVWIDREEIIVGDSIPKKIQEGLASTEFIVLVLSRRSVESGWVEREWQQKYMEEIRTGLVGILPVLIEDCIIPSLLEGKLWADFRASYVSGFTELIRRIGDQRQSKDEDFQEVVRGIDDMLKKIEEANQKPTLILAFERSAAFVAAALSQRMDIQEILVLNRSTLEVAWAANPNDPRLLVGKGVSLDLDWFRSHSPIIAKYYLNTGENLLAGIRFLNGQGIDTPPIFTMYTSPVGKRRFPEIEWVYDHRDLRSALALFPWVDRYPYI